MPPPLTDPDVASSTSPGLWSNRRSQGAVVQPASPTTTTSSSATQVHQLLRKSGTSGPMIGPTTTRVANKATRAPTPAWRQSIALRRRLHRPQMALGSEVVNVVIVLFTNPTNYRAAASLAVASRIRTSVVLAVPNSCVPERA